jgi:DNA-binding IclR family transcriptional regulator
MNELRGARGQAAVERALDLLASLVEDPGGVSLAAAAEKAGLPISTAHRLAALLVRRRLLVRGDRGRYLPGWGLAEMAAHADRRAVLAGVARPVARRFARTSGQTVHVGILEGDMVTYLVKAAGPEAQLFTREGMQLEAYGSALGKLLLSALPSAELDAYLREAPFPRLTAATLTDAATLRAHLETVRSQGYAVDDREVADDLICFAVPIRKPDGSVFAALSSAGRPPRALNARTLTALNACAAEISRRLFA